jgi:hypothetical protein
MNDFDIYDFLAFVIPRIIGALIVIWIGSQFFAL